MRLASIVFGLGIAIPLGCKSEPPPAPPPQPPPPVPVMAADGYYLMARDGVHCALTGHGNYPRYEQVIAEEKQRLQTFGIAPKEMWAAEQLNQQFISPDCIPPGDTHGMQFLEQHPWAKQGLQKYNITALCQECGCPDINYVCVYATTNPTTMQTAGYGQVK